MNIDDDVIRAPRKRIKSEILSDSDDERKMEIDKQQLSNHSKLDEGDIDEIICEMDLLFTPEIKHVDLYAVSWITKMGSPFFDDISSVTCRHKRDVEMLEVRREIPFTSGSFDPSYVPPASNDGKMSAKMLATEILVGRTSRATNTEKQYVLSIKNEAAYLTPLNGIYELSRNLDHMDISKQGNEKSQEVDTSGTDSEGETVRVKFVRPESERQKKRREASALHQEKQIESDPWISVDVKLPTDAQTVQLVDALFPLALSGANAEAQNLDNGEIEKMMARQLQSTTIHKLDPLELRKPSFSLAPVIRNGNFTVDDIVRAFIRKAFVISTFELMKLLPGLQHVEDIFTAANTISRLVRGNWVLNSEFSLDHLSVSHNKVPKPIAAMAAIRDKFLATLEFQEIPVTRRLLAEMYNIEMYHVDLILERIAAEDTKQHKLVSIKSDHLEEIANDARLRLLQHDHSIFWSHQHVQFKHDYSEYCLRTGKTSSV